MDARKIEEQHIFDLRDQGWYVVSSKLNPLGEGYRMVVTLERDVPKEIPDEPVEAMPEQVGADPISTPEQGSGAVGTAPSEPEATEKAPESEDEKAQ